MNDKLNEQRMALFNSVYVECLKKGTDAFTDLAAEVADRALAEFDKRFPSDKSIEAKAEQGMRVMGFTPSSSPKEFWVHERVQGEVLSCSQKHMTGCIESCKPFQLFPNPCVWKDPRKEPPSDNNKWYPTLEHDGAIDKWTGKSVKSMGESVKLYCDYPEPPKE